MHPLVMIDEQDRVLWANTAFFAAFGVSAGQTVGNLFHNLGSGQWAHPKLREHIHDLFLSRPEFRDFLIEHDFESVGHRRMKVSGSRVQDPSAGARPVALLSIVDVSEGGPGR